MRKGGACGLATALIACLLLEGTCRCEDATEPTSPPSKGGVWFNGWFDTKPKEQGLKPGTRQKEDLAKEAEVQKHNTDAEDTGTQRAREQARYLRRLAVCDQLKLIAVQKKDDLLLVQAEQLESRAQAIYNQRLAQMPASKAGASTDQIGYVKQTPPDAEQPAPYTVVGQRGIGRSTSTEEKP
jgi:hypothetical protein